MRVIYSYQGKEEIRTFDRGEILIGRLSPLSAPDLDFGADPTVSRKHCRIKVTNGEVWIEDLRSTNGTVVDGEYIENAPVTSESVIRTGETSIRIEFTPPPAAPAPKATPKPAQPKPAAAPASNLLIPSVNTMAPPASASAPAPSPAPQGILPPKPGAGVLPAGTPLVARSAQAAAPAPVAVSEAPKVSVVAKPAAPAAPPAAPPAPAPEPAPAPQPTGVAPAPAPAPVIPAGPAPADTPRDADFKHRLASLYQVPLSFTPDMRLPDILQAILTRVLTLIPGAKRGALMLHDPATGRVQVGASIPPGEVIVSESLARRVMEEAHGFILQRSNESTALDTKLVTVETGMYAPLLLKEKPLGAIYLDDPQHSEPFSEDDMQFLLAVAHYIAVIIFNQDLQAKIAHNASLLDRITTKFPPRVQERLLENLRLERLQPGVAKSDLPVLYADLRGFDIVLGLSPIDAAGLLRDYLGAALDAVFRYDGTLIKSGGEEIIAVFGSPEPDLQQNEKAVCAAIAMEQAVKEINAKRKGQSAPHCELAVGVHIGEVLHGFIGGGERMEFVALGGGIARASHYCKGAHDGEVLIGPEVYQKVFKIIEADRATVTHKELGEFHCYRVKTLKGGKLA